MKLKNIISLTLLAILLFGCTMDIPSNQPTATAENLISIAEARELYGRKVTVEGTATMYTEGFFGGSDSTKFYIQDESGGVQVYVPGGKGRLNIPLGAQVRVTGKIEEYKGAIEVVPTSHEKVLILQMPNLGTFQQPNELDLQEVTQSSESYIGSLVRTYGDVQRVQSFTYHTEVDIQRDGGEMLTLYIDNLTGIFTDQLEIGDTWVMTGLLDTVNEELRLLPRVQDDVELYIPAGLTLDIQAPYNFNPKKDFDLSIFVQNKSLDTASNLKLFLNLQADNFTIESISHTGTQNSSGIEWQIAELKPSVIEELTITIKPNKDAELIQIGSSEISADQFPEIITCEGRQLFAGEGVPIWAVQGEGKRSPYAMEFLSVQGIVTGVFPELDGFWVQSQNGDGNLDTSDGLFVNLGAIYFQTEPGDLVAVEGVIRETYEQTQIVPLDLDALEILSSGNSVPEAVQLDPPWNEAEAAAYLETMEGMLVAVTDPAPAVSPTNKYGEFSLLLAKHGIERLHRNSEQGALITVDDGLTLTHSNQRKMEYALNSGDWVSQISGPLAYNYGIYKIEANQNPVIDSRHQEPERIPTASSDEFRIMTWNVENLFDDKSPNPDSPPMPGPKGYQLAIDKTAATIEYTGAPDIVALQEVENIGVLERIAETPMLESYAYQAILIEGDDGRGIDVGYLVKGSLEVLDTQQYVSDVTSRHPLMIKVQIEDMAEPVFVINNHFKSMSGGEEETNKTRVAQTEWNLEVIESILDQEPEAQIALLGDLNTFTISDPLSMLTATGLRHVFELLPEEARYTYIHQGVSQALDHILLTPALFDHLLRTDIMHTNADYPPPVEGDTSAFHKSDHDPVIATFSK